MLWLQVAIATVLFAYLIIQVWQFPITYDEAYTYLNLGRWQDAYKIFLFRIANNHVLNSLLMVFTTVGFPYNPVAIRLPALIAALLYLSLAIAASQRYRASLLVFSLLVGNYFILHFMGLARGYGMSATLILAAYLIWKDEHKLPQSDLVICYLLVGAFYANFVALVVLLIMLVWLSLSSWQIFPFWKKKHLITLGVLLLVGVIGFVKVTGEGKPLFGAYQSSFSEAVIIDYIAQLTGLAVPGAIGSLIAVVLILAYAYAQFWKGKPLPITLHLILIMSVIALMAFITKKPLPTERVLIPFWPVVVLGIAELVGSFFSTISMRQATWLSIPVAALVFWQMGNQLFVFQPFQAITNLWTVPYERNAFELPYPRPNETYYIEAETENREMHNLISALKPAHTHSWNGLTLATADSLVWLNQSGVDSLPVVVQRYIRHGEVHRDTIDLNKRSYNYEGETYATLVWYKAEPNGRLLHILGSPYLLDGNLKTTYTWNN